ncbi:MAG: hypothetical protein IPO85_15625 [Saprospiraceae bacterium]|uniref:Uncharacterized protein n=1 Tax=Candidatus Defluviibacterium haderslevense TaxID=2981993 RepID=A0A9D7SCY8_9BACT|nr:hypothetical protein [Candidatus Defluviibacterium haderslevense]
MKQGQLKTLLLTVTFSFWFFSAAYSQDLLDAVKSNSKLVIELKDAYKAFHINNIISDQKEMINVFISDGSDSETKSLLDGYIKICDSLKIVQFKNDTLNSYVSKYLVSTIKSYKIAQSKGFSSSEFKKDFEKYKETKGEYMNYLYSTYSTNHFVSMTEEMYWQTNDKNTYIKSMDYTKYRSLKTTNLKEALILLDNLTKQTTNFQEYSIYQIELADQYVKHSDSLADNSNETAIGKYKSILDQKKYSIYLFEAWLKWRLVNQQHIYGISKTSDIPNNLYDKMREVVALTILDYLVKNDKDEMAINEFLLMATHPIVMRFGDYPYGNQNTVEYHQTFDEKK